LGILAAVGARSKWAENLSPENENRWRAQRYGLDKGLIDFGRGAIVPYDQLLQEMLELVAEDAEHFGCQAEVQHAHTILARGTSAHRQLQTYHNTIDQGANHNEALAAVVDMLIEETLHGV
jgi:carboxylate-amine ligase